MFLKPTKSAPNDEETVRFIQEMLVAIGTLDQSGITGMYDSATESAVRAFQQWVNQVQGGDVLTETGQVDDHTRQALEYYYDHEYTIADTQPTLQPILPPSLDFKAVNRNPDNYAMQTYTITGTVVQSIETAELSDDKTYRTHLRVAVDGDHDQMILVRDNRPYTADRVLEDDRITFGAMCFGLTSYEALSGLTITLPYFGLIELYSIE